MRSYSHKSFHAALGLQCEEGKPVAYIQLGSEKTDISPSHAAVAAVAANLLAADVTEIVVRRCILKVRRTAAENIWLSVGKFGTAFECGKDEDSHYFRIYLTQR